MAVSTRARTALDERRSELERERAIVALAEMRSPEANVAIDGIIDQVGAWSSLGRVAVSARVERANLLDLATKEWPEWADPLVTARIEHELPTRCSDPAIWRLPLPTEIVVRDCAGHADIVALTTSVTRETDPVVRRQSARLLSDLAQIRGEEVARTLVQTLRWREHAPLPLEDGQPVLGMLVIGDTLRGALATELVCWRISLVLVGGQDVPRRLDGELDMLLAPEIAAYGGPTQTIDWLHLLAAGGGDPVSVVDRLGVRGDRAYATVLDEIRTLSASPRALLPLLAHRSPIVRTRAAEVLESQPGRATLAMNRAVRWHPARTFPLRGEVVAPRLVRDPQRSQAWTDELMQWIDLARHRLDTGALRAALCLLSEPTNTERLSEPARQQVAQHLLAAAEQEIDPARAALLAQGMDAVLRRVPLAQANMPAPEQVRTW